MAWKKEQLCTEQRFSVQAAEYLKSDVHMTQALASVQEWDEKQIQFRTDRLAEEFLDL